MARAALRRRLTWQVASVLSARRESATARTIVLDLPEWPGHLPGQHLDVRLTAPDGYSAQRSYSIASAWDPLQGRVELTVEDVPDGEVSPYLVSVLPVGGPIEVRGPVGGWFVWHDDDERPVLLLAGGSGVVPLMAMVRARALAGSAAPFRLVYSTRSPEAQLYADELATLAAADTRLQVQLVYTRSAPDGWSEPVGRLDPARVGELVRDRPPEIVFVCGPTPFVEAVSSALVEAGYPAGQVKTERFG